jgi:adenine-specific DNA-methyltransferase
MRTELDVLLDKIDDPILRANIRSQVHRLRAKRTFGLVFESHLPERVRLPEHPIRVGVKVCSREESDGTTFEVRKIKGKAAVLRKVRNPNGSVLSIAEAAKVTDETAPLSSLVVIADFGDPVFPGLRRLRSIDRGGDNPAHIVIKGENHHVLEALQFTHAGKVDCIYIDPPYNSGARDWKYDNHYVDETDAYRHSKWLAFMERRLLLAKQLLNPEDSVLIVTIDEKEYLRLGLLLQQVFPSDKQQMVSIMINPKGTHRPREFSRVDEFAFFVLIGSAGVPVVELGRGPTEIRWPYLRRSDSDSVRGTRPRQFYPIYVDETTLKIRKIGEPLKPDDPLESVPAVDGCKPVFPINESGIHMEWGLTGPSLQRALDGGFVRVTPGRHANQPFTISYLTGPSIKKIERSELLVTGTRKDGSKIVVIPEGKSARPTTTWREKSHDAGAYGTSLLGMLVPGRRFPYPKSLYAVEDAIRLFVRKKPEAIVLDFFGGSGTTTHAVARLNRQDGGRRQSILITNNEVSPEEARQLRNSGFKPGDPEWEALGIFEYITRPRIAAAINGRTWKGEEIKADYAFTDEFPMSDGFNENIEFLELTYLDPEVLELDMAFNSIAPLLWLRAGATGPIIKDSLDRAGRRKPYEWTDNYGVLFNPDRWRNFVQRIPATASTAFIVTDSQTTFSGIASELPGALDVVRLYENYLMTFAINGVHV